MVSHGDKLCHSAAADTGASAWYALHTQHDTARRLAPAASPMLITPDQRGLAYADGFFSTMAVMSGELLWADYHWQRLDSHATALQLDIPRQTLLGCLKAHANELGDGVMKVIVSRAPQSIRGYGFSDDAAGRACEIWLKTMPTTQARNTTTLSLTDACTLTVQASITAHCLSAQLACLPPTLAGLKTLNRLDNVLASGELEHIKAQASKSLANTFTIGEGLVRDMSGAWVEGVMSNVFYQLSGSKANSRSQQEEDKNYLTEGQWYTPPMTQSGVAGVMRHVLIDSFAHIGKPVIIRPLMDDDLPHLSQMFFCNAVRGVMPVSKLTLLDGEVVKLSSTSSNK